jgi:hypothetical protein
MLVNQLAESAKARIGRLTQALDSERRGIGQDLSALRREVSSLQLELSRIDVQLQWVDAKRAREDG